MIWVAHLGGSHRNAVSTGPGGLLTLQECRRGSYVQIASKAQRGSWVTTTDFCLFADSLHSLAVSYYNIEMVL